MVRMVGKKKIGVLLAGLMSAALFVSCGSSETSGSLKKVGVIQYIQHPALDSSN